MHIGATGSVTPRAISGRDEQCTYHSMHRLHQDILRRDHSPGAALDALERVLQGFNSQDSSTFALGKSMSVHVEAVARHVGAVVNRQEHEKLAKVMRVTLFDGRRKGRH